MSPAPCRASTQWAAEAKRSLPSNALSWRISSKVFFRSWIAYASRHGIPAARAEKAAPPALPSTATVNINSPSSQTDFEVPGNLIRNPV
jgi:hypothetical protein